MPSKVYYNDRGERCASKHELDVTNSLIARGISYVWQPGPFEYSTPVRGGFCTSCDGSAVRQGRLYTPDLELLPSGLLVEIKGRWGGQQYAHKRGNMRHFVKQSTREIAFVFSNNGLISKYSKTRNLDWAKSIGCKAIVGTEIPEEWANG